MFRESDVDVSGCGEAFWSIRGGEESVESN